MEVAKNAVQYTRVNAKVNTEVNERIEKDSSLSRKIIADHYDKMINFLETILLDKLCMPEMITEWIKKEAQYMLENSNMDSGIRVVDNFLEIERSRGRLSSISSLSSQQNHPGIPMDPVVEMLGVFGWCVILLEKFFEMHDDLVEGVEIRNGKPTWHTLPETRCTYLQDAFFFEQFVYLLLSHYFGDDDELFTMIIRLFHSLVYNAALVQFTKNRQRSEYSEEFKRVKRVLFQQRLPQSLARILWVKYGESEKEMGSGKYSFVEGFIYNMFNPENISGSCLVL